MRLGLPALLLCAAAVGRGQTVVAVSDRIVPPGGDAAVSISVVTRGDRTLASVVDALAPLRVQPEDLAGRWVLPESEEFWFRVTRPAVSLSEIQASLKAIAASHRDWQVEFDGATQVGPADIDRARAKALPELFRETKARAELMLMEAGYRPGAILELQESIERAVGGLRISLLLRMARLGAPGPRDSIVSTMVTSPDVTYRVGPARLQASYSATPETRASLFASLAPAGLTEAHLTGVESYSNPAIFEYRFAAPVAEPEIAVRLAQLPHANSRSVEVSYQVAPAPADPGALTAAARSRATLLASLLGGTAGEAMSFAEAVPSTRVLALRTGDFSGSVIPAQRIRPLRYWTETQLPAWFRFKFAVTHEDR